MANKKSLSHPSRAAPQAQTTWRWPSSTPSVLAIPGLALPHTHRGGGVDWPRTLAAKGVLPLAAVHLHWRSRPLRTPILHCIVLDTSGSMRQAERLAHAKGFAAQSIKRAARTGDHVALWCFGGQGVQLQVAPSPARASAALRVRTVSSGGGTPLIAALAQVTALLRSPRYRAHYRAAWLWLLTDGRTREQPNAPQGLERIIVVDFDDPHRGLGQCAAWARQWGGEHCAVACVA